MNDADDRALVLGYKRGNTAAFEALMNRYQRPLLGYVAGMVGDRALAEDLVQETFMRFIRGLDDYREKDRFRAYIFTVARNVAIDHLRRKHEQPTELDCAVREDSGKDPDCRAAELQCREAVLEALAALPAEQREVILLRFFGDLSFAEIAGQTGIPLGTALGRSYYGLRKLRSLLGRFYQGVLQ
ncbi:MAG: sigma-70 family RNA polymerase sigma factor [Candidatus Schekmanbacteria bacterium]|nr:sigma-70 family RNA polymerase sigma factor [Candidatus Schekmanbacteria bacterium]